MSFFKRHLVTTVVCLFVLLSLCPQESHGFIGAVKTCWDQWSRCTGWSSFGTGRLWKGCNTHCRNMGKSGGSCVLVTAKCPFSKKAYQCQCH